MNGSADSVHIHEGICFKSVSAHMNYYKEQNLTNPNPVRAEAPIIAD